MKQASDLRQLPRPRDASPDPSAPLTPAASTGLNKDLEIRRHYTAPLISETRDIPAASILAERVLPICYEEGLASGAASGPLIGELLGTALEFFVKESLASMLGPTRTDAPLSDPTAANPAAAAAAGAAAPTEGATSAAPAPTTPSGESLPDGAAASAEGIRTAVFKKKVAREEAAARRGELKRNEAGLLPTEVAAQRAQAQGRGLAGDLRVSWDLGDPWLTSLMPWHGERLLAHDEMEYMQIDEEEPAEGLGRVGGLRLPRSESAVVVNGDTKMGGIGQEEPPDDMMAIDEADWGWKGGKEMERKELGGILDECLAIGV